MKYDLNKVHDLPHGTFFGIFFLFFCYRFISSCFSTLDVEVIIYKAGCVVEVRNGELRKVELDVFDSSMKPGETVVEWNSLFFIVCAMRNFPTVV
jgi:hypothetical protein